MDKLIALFGDRIKYVESEAELRSFCRDHPTQHIKSNSDWFDFACVRTSPVCSHIESAVTGETHKLTLVICKHFLPETPCSSFLCQRTVLHPFVCPTCNGSFCTQACHWLCDGLM
jgi:hypothetical protein